MNEAGPPPASGPAPPPTWWRLLQRTLAPAAPILTAWASTRISDALWIRVLLSLFCGLAILGAPIAALFWLPRRLHAILRLVVGLALALLLSLFFSLLHLKHLRLEDSAHGPSQLRSRLLPLENSTVYESGWNRVRIADRPVAADNRCAGEVHLIVPFVWTKWEGNSARDGAERSYIGDAYFVAHYDQEVDAGALVSGLELRDYSIGPYQGPLSYLLGWAEGPYIMMAEIAPFRAAVRVRLEPPRGVDGAQ